MLLLAVVLVDRVRPLIPATLLSATSVPFSIAAVSVGVVSSVLPMRCFHRLDHILYRAYMRLCLFVFENVSGAKLSFYGDVKECVDRPSESVLFICNHQSSVDWCIANMLAFRQGSEHSIRYVLKDILQYVPLFGWYFYQHGFVYIRRGETFSPAPMLKQLDYLRDTSLPFWLVIFPEGTRYSILKSKAIESSRQYSIANNLPILENVLMPKSRGFALIMKQLATTFDAVYDVTIGYEQTRYSMFSKNQRSPAPDMFEFCCGSIRHKALHVHVRRFAIDQLPIENAETMRNWLIDRFIIKDRLMKQFYETGEFPELIDANCSAAPLSSTLPPTIIFTTALLLPIFNAPIRRFYISFALIASPVLFTWMWWRRRRRLFV